MAKDYYKILGVDKKASTEEIKKAYKKLAKQFHPDLNKAPDAADKFKEINEAAAVLGDSTKRNHYDQFGTVDGQGFGGFDYRDFQGQGFDFESMFENLFQGFGFGGRRRGPARGHDLIYDLDIDLEEAAKGVKKAVSVVKQVSCETCDGTGAATKSALKTCSECKGSGVLKITRRTPFGMFATQTTCKTCEGTGEVIEKPCKTCKGRGRIDATKELEIKVPAGVEDAMRLRLSGEGEAGERGASPGDLYVTVHVKPHKIFKRDGDDLIIEAPITFGLAAMGGTIEVPTLDGPEEMRIPAGTQPGTEFRLKARGLPNLRGYGTGSMIIIVTVKVPDKLTKKQAELLKEFEGETKRKKTIFGF